jgi:GNAT superfamily N-acetyltransferase
MQTRPIRHRRARRVDFDAIRALIEACGLPVPSTERAALRHFRRVVADLGGDLYVADVDAHVLGVVHVTYSRHLAGPPHGSLELVAVAPDARGQGIGRGLVAFVAGRARRRGCVALRCGAPPASDGVHTFLLRTGWRGQGETLEFDLAVRAQ